MVTRAAVAQRAGVSGTTVSYVLGGRAEEQRIAPDTVERVRAAASELGYVPHTVAADLRRGRTGRIALVLGGLDRPRQERIIAAALEACRAADLQLSVSFDQKSLLSVMGQVDGTLLWSDLYLELDLRDRLALCGRPLVIVGDSQVGDLPWLRVDAAAAVRAAVAHCTGQGLRHLVFASDNTRRVAAFTQACRREGVAGRLWPQTTGYADGHAVARERLAQEDVHGCGLIAGNDAAAIGMLGPLMQHDLRPGVDCGLIGFDDLPASAWTAPSITSVAPDYGAIARHALARPDGSTSWRRKNIPQQIRARTSTRMA
ncbi:MAG: LacI family DNA-binding transcriptional regulator [Planctomycetota bacterium]